MSRAGGDLSGAALRLARPARRIVSLVPSLTALLGALGLEEEVLGLTRFCVEPAGWKARKVVIGGTKDLRPERIAALAPDLILANREENVAEQVEALAALAPIYLCSVSDLGEDQAMIREVGELVGRADEAESLARQSAAAFAALPPYAPLRALYLIWRGPYMSIGGDTFISAVMGAGGLENVCGGQTRYPSLEPSELQALAPEVILLSSEPYPFGEEHLAELSALAPDAQVLLVDGVPFSWYGSEAARAPSYLRELRARLGSL